MREWTREEKYRYLKDPQELKELYDRISKSGYRQTFHNQAVTGLMNDPNGFVWHDNRWHLFYQWCPWGAVHGLKHASFPTRRTDMIIRASTPDPPCLLMTKYTFITRATTATRTGPATLIHALPGSGTMAGRRNILCRCSGRILTTQSTRETPRS